MGNYVKAVLYAYPSLGKMEEAYKIHIRNMAVLSYREDIPAVAMAGKIVGEIAQKSKLVWLKALVERSVRRLSEEERETIVRVFRWDRKKKTQSADGELRKKYRRLSKKLLDKLGKNLENEGLSCEVFERYFSSMELFRYIDEKLNRKNKP